jgi:hypothetical protein
VIDANAAGKVLLDGVTVAPSQAPYCLWPIYRSRASSVATGWVAEIAFRPAQQIA